LAKSLDVIAERFDLDARELVVDRFDLLQADDVGRAVPQPYKQIAQASLDAVDVPGDDFHVATVIMNPSRRSPEKWSGQEKGQESFPAPLKRRSAQAVFGTARTSAARSA
jgi:hypothetical protein